MKAMMLSAAVLFFCAAIPVLPQDSATQLKPQLKFIVSGQVREMRATTDTIWTLTQSKSGDLQIIGSDYSGNTRSTIALPPSARAVGLAATTRGIATTIVKDRQAALTEFDSKGSQVSQTQIPCYGSESLMAINGNPATICPDGTITEYEPGRSPAQKLSWIRPGTLAENLSNKQFAIIDRATGQVVLNDVSQGTITPLSAAANAPEIKAALARNQVTAKNLPSGSPPLGRQLVVMSSTHDDTGWYELIWPYDSAIGPVVVKLTNEGALAKRIQCVVPNVSGSLHKIDVRNGYLILAAGSGEIFLFKL